MNKILLIDDDEELCELVGEYLGVEGFEISAVHDGVSGLKEALSGAFDLLILASFASADTSISRI